MTEDALYARYLQGDPDAGDELMLRLGDGLTAYLNAFLHDPGDAEDLMLDCFTVILVKRPAIREGRFRAYLFKTARHKACRLWRTRLRRQEFSLDESLPADGPGPEDAAWKSERGRILDRCLNRIPPQYREALWLVHGMGMSREQAAAVLGCSLTKIGNLLKNGKNRLRPELEKEGITHADA